LLGTFYGGDGKSTFALPNMQGNAPMMQGQGQGLTDRFIGEASGSEAITLLTTEIPFHTHTVGGQNVPLGGVAVPASNETLNRPASGNLFIASNPNVAMAPEALAATGGGLPHNNMQPYLTLNFCIALQGIFPQRG
jgi:microcystin-dependent protein